MPSLPDAPDIARTMQTGYPYEAEHHVCSRCGNTATVCGYSYGDLCTPCALAVWDELTAREQLELLGFDYL